MKIRLFCSLGMMPTTESGSIYFILLPYLTLDLAGVSGGNRWSCNDCNDNNAVRVCRKSRAMVSYFTNLAAKRVAVYDSRVGAVIRRCIKPSHVIHLALHKQVFLYIEPSSLHITIDLVSTKYFNKTRMHSQEKGDSHCGKTSTIVVRAVIHGLIIS